MKIVVKSRNWNPLCWLGLHKMGFEMIHLNVSWPFEERRETIAMAINVCQRRCGHVDMKSVDEFIKKVAADGYEVLDDTIVMDFIPIEVKDNR